MAWNDAPPTKDELKTAKAVQSVAWNEAPPTKDELEPDLLDRQIPYIGGTGRGHLRGLVNSLPMAGTIAGGLLGSVEPGAGTLLGAGMGGAAGGWAKNWGEQLLGDEKTYSDMIKAPIGGAVEGVASEMGGQSIGAGAKALARTPIGKKTLDAIGSGLAKTGETLSGVPEKVIKTYAKYRDEVKGMANASDNSVPEAADQIREKLMSSIKNFKGTQNDEIAAAIENLGLGKRQDVGPIIEALEKEKLKYNAKANPEAIRAIENLQKKVMAHTPGEVNAPYSGPVDIHASTAPSSYGPLREESSKGILANYGGGASEFGRTSESGLNAYGQKKLGSQTGPSSYGPEVEAIEQLMGSPRYTPKKNPSFSPSGYGDEAATEAVRGSGKYVQKPEVDKTVSAQDLNRIKNYLQGIADPAYMKTGQIFDESSAAQSAAKSGGRTARGLLNDMSPEVAASNAKLSRLHELEDLMNSNLIAEGKPEAALLGAGSGGNERNSKLLKELDELVGGTAASDAEKLAAMRTFGSPKLIAQDATGKAAGRMGLASGLGFLIGNAPGAVAAAALTSPAGVKAAIDGGILTAKMLNSPQVQTALGRELLDVAKGEFSKKEGRGLIRPNEDAPPRLGNKEEKIKRTSEGR